MQTDPGSSPAADAPDPFALVQDTTPTGATDQPDPQSRKEEPAMKNLNQETENTFRISHLGG
jgi:hypothetical protein